MRVTSAMYYDNLYGSNNSKINESLFDVNKQISSGLKIQYAKDDVRTFAETMRLDNELATLSQIKKSTESGYKVSNQTDVVLNEFSTTMERMRTLIIQASNGTQSDSSLDAIANELRVVEDHFKNLSNTSINGQYLFSGTAVDIKPISPDGTYNGNDGSLKAFLGSGTQQQYNMSGSQLFLGEEVLTKRMITTNVVQPNLSEKYNFATGVENEAPLTPVKESDTIRDLMGDTDTFVDTENYKHHFYIRGTKSDGTTFKEKVSMKDDDSISELLIRIGDAYGNTPNLNIVNVSLNKSGQIVIEDKIKGSSKIDFHMVGAVDFGREVLDINAKAKFGSLDINAKAKLGALDINAEAKLGPLDINARAQFGAVDAADVDNIDLLDVGESNFSEIMNPTNPPANNLYVKEFVKSGYKSSLGAPEKLEALVYDRTMFSKDGSNLSSSVSQIVRADNSFANGSTKISEVADLSQPPSVGSLDGTQLKLTGTDVRGEVYDVQIDLATAGTTFSLDGGTTNFNVFTIEEPRSAISADDMTYKQLMDIVNIVVTNNTPATFIDEENENRVVPTNIPTDYDNAIKASSFNGNTFLSYDGKINFREIGTSDTLASMAIHDASSGNFSDGASASVVSFNTNNSIAVVDAKTDFFKEIDEIITAVEDHKTHPDASSGSVRNLGMENSITKIDALQEHFIRSHSLVGAQSNALTRAKERTDLLELSTKTLRSDVLDTDIAESQLALSQLKNNYEAMLSTVGKVSKLNLVNYL
ncbi:flagellar biosynthesis protein FlgL [Sulfurimonas sp. CS5]|uniref:flagellin N-terminal helical domain-containing protein n=1 Tax=Sulfurimonas sp. CS5 TaxID=3391145 RepID=UPI0039EA2FCC